ncbi:MAG TPA: sigma-70 family RNA polymerase sigma factor [Candidatus Dormibacteraeota bacterium]|nr:sigma-70 family RNA polymerase sigma factor [Candidatus Dormibacteraeota bacterium]
MRFSSTAIACHDAEDLVQETFLRAWRGRHRFEGRTSFRSWLYRIATNACLNARRANARRVLPETLGLPGCRARGHRRRCVWHRCPL